MPAENLAPPDRIKRILELAARTVDLDDGSVGFEAVLDKIQRVNDDPDVGVGWTVEWRYYWSMKAECDRFWNEVRHRSERMNEFAMTTHHRRLDKQGRRQAYFVFTTQPSPDWGDAPEALEYN